MLYVTTRSNTDTYTSHKALSTNTAPDGGYFVPFKLRRFSDREIADLQEKSFGQTVADVLNYFFNAGLSAWDVDFAIGKNPSNIHAMNHRMLVCELWHNPGAGLDYCIQRIYEKLCEGKSADKTPGDWAKTSVRIAVLFAAYGQLLQQKLLNTGDQLDLVVSAEDFRMPMAAWYARSMGLPIQTVICACDDRSNVWELIHKGSFATAGVSEGLLLGVEKLVSASLTAKEAMRFAEVCGKNGIYTLDAESIPAFSNGFYCTVAGKGRADATVNSVFRSNHYLMDPIAALCFSALQDYRAGTGISQVSLLLAESSPMNHSQQIMKATGLTQADLRKIITR